MRVPSWLQVGQAAPRGSPSRFTSPSCMPLGQHARHRRRRIEVVPEQLAGGAVVGGPALGVVLQAGGQHAPGAGPASRTAFENAIIPPQGRFSAARPPSDRPGSGCPTMPGLTPAIARFQGQSSTKATKPSSGVATWQPMQRTRRRVPSWPALACCTCADLQHRYRRLVAHAEAAQLGGVVLVGGADVAAHLFGLHRPEHHRAAGGHGRDLERRLDSRRRRRPGRSPRCPGSRCGRPGWSTAPWAA